MLFVPEYAVCAALIHEEPCRYNFEKVQRDQKRMSRYVLRWVAEKLAVAPGGSGA